jgi:hypothetical protein
MAQTVEINLHKDAMLSATSDSPNHPKTSLTQGWPRNLFQLSLELIPGPHCNVTAWETTCTSLLLL